MTEVVDPQSRMADLIGLLYVLNNIFEGKADLYQLEKEMEVDLDELMPIVFTAARIGFVNLESGDISSTVLGKELIASSIKRRKEIIKESLKNVEPFKTAIELREFDIDQLLEELGSRGVQTFNSPTGHHDLEVMLIEWGIYSGLIRKDEGKFIIA